MDLASKEFLKLYSLLLEERSAATEQRILNSRDALQAYFYARDVIRGRWPEAEEFIKKDTEYACWYAFYIIKGRWPEAEDIIKKDPWVAFCYARYIIEGRWPEAERFIKKDAGYACWYARHVIKGRWPEAEKYIKKSDHYWDEYKSLICKECNGEGIIDLSIGGAEEECSTCFGKGFDPSKL